MDAPRSHRRTRTKDLLAHIVQLLWPSLGRGKGQQPNRKFGSAQADILLHLASSVRAPFRRPRLFAFDMFLCAGAFTVAALCRFGFTDVTLSEDQINSLVLSAPVFVTVCAFVLPLMGLYSRNWRFASVSDLLAIVKAVVLASIVFVSLMFVFTRLNAIPRTVIVIEIFMLTAALAAVRLRFRLSEASHPHSQTNSQVSYNDLVPILLVGAGHSADLFLRALQRDINSRYWPVAILDPDPEEQGLFFRGVPILGSLDAFPRVLKDLERRNQRPRHLIFTDSLSRFGESMAQELIERAETLGIAVSRLPPPTELRRARSENEIELRQIELTDLLERPQASLDRHLIERFIQGRRVLVTGSGGSIGSELTKQIASFGPTELVLIDFCEYNLYAIDLELSECVEAGSRTCYLCNVRDAERVNEIFERHRPEVVFHAAALKHVPMVELNPCEGVLTNVIGTRNVAEASRRFGALAMIQVSTDKVVNSTSVMGVTKRLAELYCQALDIDGENKKQQTRFMTVRFGNVLGSSGSLIPLFKRQLARGGPLTVTHPEMTRFFMTIREAVELTLHASAHGLERRVGTGEIFVLDMGQPVKVMDVARRMIRLAGFSPENDIEIRIIGCRPGEKLFEELFDTNEQRVASSIPGVFGAIPHPVALPILRMALERLQESAQVGDVPAMFEVVEELVPTYHGHRAVERDREVQWSSPGAPISKLSTHGELGYQLRH